jgi:hypothetical protein
MPSATTAAFVLVACDPGVTSTHKKILGAHHANTTVTRARVRFVYL